MLLLPRAALEPEAKQQRAFGKRVAILAIGALPAASTAWSCPTMRWLSPTDCMPPCAGWMPATNICYWWSGRLKAPRGLPCMTACAVPRRAPARKTIRPDGPPPGDFKAGATAARKPVRARHSAAPCAVIDAFVFAEAYLAAAGAHRTIQCTCVLRRHLVVGRAMENPDRRLADPLGECRRRVGLQQFRELREQGAILGRIDHIVIVSSRRSPQTGESPRTYAGWPPPATTRPARPWTCR